MKFALLFTNNLGSRCYFCWSRREQAGGGSLHAASEWESGACNSNIIGTCALPTTVHRPGVRGSGGIRERVNPFAEFPSKCFQRGFTYTIITKLWGVVFSNKHSQDDDFKNGHMF